MTEARVVFPNTDVWNQFLRGFGEEGICASLPFVERPFLTEESWKEFVRSKGLQNAPTFQALFRAQQEGDPEVFSGSEVDAVLHQLIPEMKFVKTHGEPLAIIPLNRDLIASNQFQERTYALLRMNDGNYFLAVQANEGSAVFTEISLERGRKIEAEVARKGLEDLNARFERGEKARLLSVPGLAITKSSKPSRLSHSSKGEGESFYFAEREYPEGSAFSKIFYHPESEVGKLFLYQGAEYSCVAYAIWNGAIWQEGNLPKEEGLVDQFFRRSQQVQGLSGAQGLSFAQMIDGRIPGIQGRGIDASEIKAALAARKPVIAAVDYYGGHAVLVSGVDEERGVFQAVDTMSGMVIEERFKKGLREDVEDFQQNVRDKIHDLRDGGLIRGLRRGAGVLSGLKQDLKELEIEDFIRLSQRLRQVRSSGLTGELLTHQKRDSSFYIIEVTDPEALLDWIKQG